MFVDHRFDYLTEARYYISYVVRPVQWLTDAPVKLGTVVQTNMKSRSSLIDENARLREQLFLQQSQLQTLGWLKMEVERQSELLNAADQIDEMTVQARISGEAPDPTLRRVQINKGQAHGVFTGQPVIDPYGLMGQVVEVEPYSSWVLLLTDPEHGTPVEVNRNGVRTIAYGNENNPNELILRNLPNTVDVKVGDVLVTSGLGGRFPAGYKVGEVTSVQPDPGQPFARITAVPTAHLNRSRNVLLVF